MKAFINAGHKVGIDPGACNPNGTTEADVVLKVGKLVCDYLNAAGVDTEFLQSNSLRGEDENEDNPSICRTANNSGANIFVSIHCNAGGGKGTETLVYDFGGKAAILADCIQTQIVDSIGTVDRGIKERTNLAVLKYTSMPAVLVELAFIDTECGLILDNIDEFARAIARGVTDYQNTVL